ncbi:NlpC/P60 family protein [Veillonella sp.]|uniref:C40 family peptidase n=1 Tax=Veillonella sp. TaxID=1926307 RepID=UPI0025D508E1|nr:NlpC/P60 family protein [Veillonella sp.]
MKSIQRKVALAAAMVLVVGSHWVVSAASYTYGAKGGDIPAIQKKLIAAGYNARLNGEYDANTKWAVRLYQRDNGLPVNGVLDATTYKKLMGKSLNEKTVASLGRMSDEKIAAEMAAGRKSASTVKASDSETAESFKVDKKATKTKADTKKGKQTSKSKDKTSQSKSSSSSSLLDPIEPDFIFTKTANVPKSVRTILKEAESYSGVPYLFGGTTPKGFDCSGYVRYVFAKSGITLPRSADEQYTVGQKIGKHNLQPGDLVFFQTYEQGVSHSGIYIGEGKFISATSSRGVTVANINDGYWGERYIGAKRVI